jgi:hypothetical protein
MGVGGMRIMISLLPGRVFVRALIPSVFELLAALIQIGYEL